MSDDQSSTAGSSLVTSSENIAADTKPLLILPDVPVIKSETPSVSTEELSKSLQEYGSTLAEIAVATSDAKFKEELTAIESWYQVLSRSERTTSIYTLLQHSDQDQKRFFIALIQQLLKAEVEATANASSEDNQLKPKPFARGLRPPSLNLPLPGSPSTPRFTPATSRGESFATAPNTANENANTMNANLNVPNVTPLTPQALNAVAASGLSTEAQMLAIQLVMSGLVQPTSAHPASAVPKSARKHLNTWRAPASAKYPGSALRHSALRSAGLKSAGLKSAVPDSAMEGGVTPREEDFDPEVLKDIPSWLRSLRLHKYTSCFDGLTWQEMVLLNDETLEKRGIATLGARRRLMRTFDVVKKKMGMEGESESNVTPKTSALPEEGGDAEHDLGQNVVKLTTLSANSPVFIPRELRGSQGLTTSVDD